MKTRIAPLTLGVLFALCVPSSRAAIELSEYRFNIDSAIVSTGAGLNLAGFDTSSGLGTILFSQTGAGVHYFGTFVDHEIDKAINGVANELGFVNGAPAAGQS